MIFPADLLLALLFRSLWPVKDKKREEGFAHKTRAPKEKGSKFGVLSLATIRGMKEPDASINTDSQTASPARITFEPVMDSKLGQRPLLARRSQDLS